MKTFILACLVMTTLFISACGAGDTTTQMPEGGYKERSDSGSTTGDSVVDVKDKSAVAVDTVKNGQAVISGATSDSSK